MSAAGAASDVYAIDPCDELLQLAADAPRGAVVHASTRLDGGRFEGAAVAIGAFDDDEEAARICLGRACGGRAGQCDRQAGVLRFCLRRHRQSFALVIGISTDGAAPVFAQAIRAKLEALLPKGFAALGCGGGALARRGEGVGSVVRRPPQVLAGVHRACGDQPRDAHRPSAISSASSPRSRALGARLKTAR